MTGRLSIDERDFKTAKDAYLEFTGANPPPGPRVDDAKRALATTLRSI